MSVDTIRRFGELADRGQDPAVAAKAWSQAGFDDERAAQWLDARCFDPVAARELEELDITPAQAAKSLSQLPRMEVD